MYLLTLSSPCKCPNKRGLLYKDTSHIGLTALPMTSLAQTLFRIKSQYKVLGARTSTQELLGWHNSIHNTSQPFSSARKWRHLPDGKEDPSRHHQPPRRVEPKSKCPCWVILVVTTGFFWHLLR